MDYFFTAAVPLSSSQRLIPVFTLSIFTILISYAHITPYAASVPPISGKHGAIATDHEIASRVGLDVMKAGGNAVDAACAAVFTLGVVQPVGSGIGGGAFMMIKAPNTNNPVILDFRETAPAAASRDMFIKPGVAKDASKKGGLAVGVPGEVAGCVHAIKSHGKLALRMVMRPAIRFAKRGFPVGKHLARYLTKYQADILKNNSLRKDFAKNGAVLKEGDVTKRPRLARVLETIAKEGTNGFYKGWVADDIIQTVKQHGGILTHDDLSNYTIKKRTPMTATLLGYNAYLMPPPSSGGIALVQSLRILATYKLKKLGHNASAYLHILAEVLKHVFADRARYLGDSDFIKIPTKQLLSKETLDRYRSNIGESTRPIEQYGSKSLAKAPVTDHGTSHLSVIDGNGLAVSVTSSVNYPLGALIAGDKTGIIFNNTMNDFSARPGEPNAFGLIQSEANTIAPGKRPLSSMSPTILTKDGKVEMIVGGSGGPTIITGILQVILNHIIFGRHVTDAVSLPRIHHQWMPNQLWVEEDIVADVRYGLSKRGHMLKPISHPFTAVQALVRNDDGSYSPASDPRKKGVPAAY